MARYTYANPPSFLSDWAPNLKVPPFKISELGIRPLSLESLNKKQRIRECIATFKPWVMICEQT